MGFWTILALEALAYLLLTILIAPMAIAAGLGMATAWAVAAMHDYVYLPLRERREQIQKATGRWPHK